MNKSKVWLIATVIFGLSTAVANADPYVAKFKGRLVEYQVTPGVPAIQAKVSFGPIMSYYEYPRWCMAPPPFFGVAIDWKSPNSPDCWINVFLALETGGHYNVYRGNGRIRLENGYPRDMTCYWPLRCGYNAFTIDVWPLVSGEYRFRLISFDFYRWPGQCLESKPYYTWFYFRPYISDERQFKIHEEANDFIIFSHLYYFQPERHDTTFDGGSLNVFSDYRIYTKIVTTKQEETIPLSLTGYLKPQGELITDSVQVDFHRWPEGDEGPPCDPLFPVRIYAYESDKLTTPYDLWNYTPEQWNNIFRELICVLYGDGNGVENDIENTVYVMSMLSLDCLNDSTVCFIPVDGEQMAFMFRYSEALEFGPETEMTFNIEDREDNLVYTIPLPPTEFESEPNDFGFPTEFQFRQMLIVWNGREDGPPGPGPGPGLCVDPDLSSYKAQVRVADPAGDMMSNIESFDVVPKMDSILITHTPSYPPPEPLQNVEIFSVIRGKIDDSGVPMSDFRYYRLYGEIEDELNFWDNESFWFWDLVAPQEPLRQRRYFEDNDTLTLPLTDWNAEIWGELDYKWKIIHDWRIAQYTVGYDDIIDTTWFWDNEWKACITAPFNWPLQRFNPYMRLLVVSEVSNKKNGYLLQNDTSATGREAHKLIFTQDTGDAGLDIVDWGVSHIGVPYAILDGHHKLPYEKIECSSFVTATRIQEIGPENNTKYAVSYIVANDYLRGYYYFLGERKELTTKIDPCNEPGIGIARGYLLHLMRNRRMPHIAVIMEQYYNCQDRRPYWCFIVHARGGYPPRYGRVCFDNAEIEYLQRTSDTPNNYHYNYLKWVE